MPLRVTKQKAKILQHRLDGGADEVTPKRNRRNLELELQGLLFDHIKNLEDTYPDLKRVFASLTGVYIPKNLLIPISRAGLRRGILDIWCIVSRGDCPGLVIDLKTPTGTATKEQKEWVTYLRAQGWQADIIKGAWATWQRLAAYLGITGADYEATKLRRDEETLLKMMGE